MRIHKVFFCETCKEVYCNHLKGKSLINCHKCKNFIPWIVQIPKEYIVSNKFQCKKCCVKWSTRHLYIRMKCRNCRLMCLSSTIGNEVKIVGIRIFKLLRELKYADDIDKDTLSIELDSAKDKYRLLIMDVGRNQKKVPVLGKKNNTKKNLYKNYTF